MRSLLAIISREFISYLRSPLTYVFILVFLIASTLTSFMLGDLVERDQANLASYFSYLPWIHLFFAPAIGMRLWSKEYRLGTFELLLTLPITKTQIILGKFFAALALLTISLLLSSPLALTIEYLGNPDWGSIVGGYLGGILLGASFLAITCATSAFTKDQSITFIISLLINLTLLVLATNTFTDFLATMLPVDVVKIIASLGVLDHFSNLAKGVIDTRDLVYFLILIVYSLYFNGKILEFKKAI